MPERAGGISVLDEMWIQWKKWIIEFGNAENRGFFVGIFKMAENCFPQIRGVWTLSKSVDIVENYFPSRKSPIL